jgi:hypothetical protein
MNLVFMSNTITPNRKENVDWILHKKESSETQKLVDLLPYNTFGSEVFFEYTRLNNDWIRDEKWNDVNITEELPNTEKYVIIYDTFNPIGVMENMVSKNSPVSNKIISDLKASKCSIVFFHTDLFSHGFNKDDWEDFYTAVKGIDLKRFYFLFDEQVMNDDFKDIDLGFNVFTERSWPAHYTLQSDNWARSQDGYQPSLLLSLLENTRGYYRQFKYCSHNNNIKDHRVELLLFLIKNDLLDGGVWSWFGGNEPIDQGVNELDFTNFESAGYGKIDYSKEYGKEAVDIAHNLVPYTYDYKVDGLQDYLNIIPYFNSYFNIVTESVWGPGYDNTHPQKIHITEKVWKCMTTFQPFVLISNKNNLKKLREWGFKTFHPHIDESYDELDTYKERKVLLEKEIERLCNMTIVELDEWYWSMQDILIHNHKHYVKFMKYQYSGITDFINTAYNNLNEE